MSRHPEPHVSPATIPNDPRYAWVMLPLAMLMHMGTSPGQTFGVSLFNEPIRETLGLSHSQLTGSYLVASLLAAVPLMFIGRRMDRHGLRWVTLALVSLVGLGCVLISQVGGLVGLTVGFFLLRSCGQGGLAMAASNTLGTWFVKRLGLASGIAGVGMSATIAVTPLVYHQLIEAVGWRSAYYLLGIGTWAVLIPLLLLLYRNSPLAAATNPPSHGAAATAEADRLQFDLRAAMRTPAYWIAVGCTSLTGLICTAVFFNLVPLLQGQGLSGSQAAVIFPTVAVAMAVFQMKGGLLADRVPLRVLLAVAMAGLAAGVLVFNSAATLLWAQVAAALVGGGQGLMSVTNNTLWPRYFGRRHLGEIRSSVWTANIAACAAGPFVMGVTLDALGSYALSLWLFFAMAAGVGVGAIAWGGPPARYADRGLPLAAAAQQ